MLNLGILAHVDAGKTSLTERLLFAAGAIDALGRVDDGDTVTDSLALERARGITIRAAVASFGTTDAGGHDVGINLIDTPGHPDFVAEVERVLGVLDGAILVVSAVEGVQAQTRILMRALRRLSLPTIVFVNKVDRSGARPAEVLREVTDRLDVATVAMGTTAEAGSAAATVRPFERHDRSFTTDLLDRLAERDDRLVADYVDRGIGYGRLRRELVSQTQRGLVHPVFFGSAMTGVGLAELMDGVTGLLPTTSGSDAGTVAGTVFKVERGAAGEKVAYVRLRSGTVHVRDRLRVGPGAAAKVTAISVFERGPAQPGTRLSAGQIGKLWGLDGVHIGDSIGGADDPGAGGRHFAPPTLESIVIPHRGADRMAMHAALTQLAEQDPLINVRRDGQRQETSVSLYGEVQKEIIAATLADDYGIEVDFQETTTICVERVAGTGEAVEPIANLVSPFLAGIGLRVAPGRPGRGISFGLEVELGAMPLAFFNAVEETVHQALRQGLYGWEVLDCDVAMTYSDYWPRQSHMHGTFDKTMSSTAGDFRFLTPLVLMQALRRAGTVVHEPVHRFQLELPTELLGTILPAVLRLGGQPMSSTPRARSTMVEGEIPAGRVHQLRQQLPGLTRGEGMLESTFGRYAPVTGPPPARPRTDHNPLNRKEYLIHVVRRV